MFFKSEYNEMRLSRMLMIIPSYVYDVCWAEVSYFKANVFGNEKYPKKVKDGYTTYPFVHDATYRQIVELHRLLGRKIPMTKEEFREIRSKNPIDGFSEGDFFS